MKKIVHGLVFLVITFLVNTVVFSQESSLLDLKKRAEEFYKEKKYESAIEVTKQALQIAEQKFGKESMEAAEFLGNLGALYQLQGKEMEGKELLKKARDIRYRHGTSGVPVGIQTEAFFDGIMKEKQKAAGVQEDTPLQFEGEWSVKACDYDNDNDCDEDDLARLKDAWVDCKEEVLEDGTIVNNFDECMPEKTRQSLIETWKVDAEIFKTQRAK